MYFSDVLFNSHFCSAQTVVPIARACGGRISVGDPAAATLRGGSARTRMDKGHAADRVRALQDTGPAGGVIFVQRSVAINTSHVRVCVGLATFDRCRVVRRLPR